MAQHRWPRAFQRRVTGSQTRLPATRPATPAIVFCSVTPSSRIATATSAASTSVPATLNANLRVVAHAPVVRRGWPAADEQRGGAHRCGDDARQDERS